MSVEVVPGGQRRIDRVLDPGFTDGVDRLGLPELRARREEAEAEEADVSYLRRLLQGRLDILRAELVRRSATDEQDVAGLLAGLPAILTDDAPGTFSAVPARPGAVAGRGAPAPGRAAGLGRDHRPPARAGRRGADQGGRGPCPEEEKVSTHRRTVQRVVDVLRGELARRYRDGTAQVSQLLE